MLNEQQREGEFCFVLMLKLHISGAVLCVTAAVAHVLA